MHGVALDPLIYFSEAFGIRLGLGKAPVAQKPKPASHSLRSFSRCSPSRFLGTRNVRPINARELPDSGQPCAMSLARFQISGRRNMREL